MDLIVSNWELPLRKNFSQRVLTGVEGHATLTVSARVTCANGMLSPNCSGECVLGKIMYLFCLHVFSPHAGSRMISQEESSHDDQKIDGGPRDIATGIYYFMVIC